MRRIRVTTCVMAIATVFPVYVWGADSMSTDALIVLTQVGYLTGAADGCGVAPEQSNALSGGIALAISRRKYGDPAQAHVLLNNARQKGIAAAATRKVDCGKISDAIRNLAHSLLAK